MSLRQLLFSFEGRIRRSDWWVGIVILLVAQLAIGFAAQAWFAVATSERSVGEVITPTTIRNIALAGLAVSLALAWPFTALNAKRLHDRDIATWPAVALSALLLLGPSVKFVATLDLMARGPGGGLFGTFPGQAFELVVLALGLGMLVVLGFLPGQSGANRFGPPLGTAEPAKT